MKRSLLVIAALFAFSLVTAGQVPGGTPAKAGHATFKIGDAQITFDQVQGDFRESYGFTAVTLNFSKDGKPGDHLRHRHS